MNTATTRRIAQTTAEDFHRLADQGERKGIKILLTADGEHFATSTSNPTMLHRVSERGCDCKGFAAWGRCSHHSLLLSQLGGIPDVEPTVNVTNVVILDEQPALCRSCRGTGFVRMTTGPALSDWMMAPCTNCTGHQPTSPGYVVARAAHAA